MRMGGEKGVAGFMHFAVRLDTDDEVACIEEGAGEKACAGADISDGGSRIERGFAGEEIDDRRWVAGAEADVIGYAVAEASSGVVQLRHGFILVGTLESA